MIRYYVVSGDRRHGPFIYESDAEVRAVVTGGVVEEVRTEGTAAEPTLATQSECKAQT